MNVTQPIEELDLQNTVVVTVQGRLKAFPLTTLNLNFESPDDVVLTAVSNALREELDAELPSGSFVIQRNAETNSVSIFPKTELGATCSCCGGGYTVCDCAYCNCGQCLVHQLCGC